DVTAPIRHLGLLVDPRVTDNERLGAAQIDEVFRQMLAGGRIGTVIFFGQANAVLGYPYALPATVDAFKAHGVNFGDVEAYDPNQIQKGSQTLARAIVTQTVRVQAISKLEMDKLDLETIVSRYILGVRERNIRVIYLRPFPHVVQIAAAGGSVRTESAERANLDMIRELHDRLAANGFRAGRAEGLVDFKSRRLQFLYFVAALGVAAAFVLLLDLYGWARPWIAWIAYGATVAAFLSATALHHDISMRKLWALGGGLTFGVLAGAMTAAYFTSASSGPSSFVADASRGALCLLRAAAFAVLGGLFITGLLSQAAFMIEAEQFVGVKLLLVLPPLLLLALYSFTDRFGARPDGRRLLQSPVRAWQLGAVFILAIAGVLLVARSGNQPDVSVSGFESHVRGALTALLGARPRFKEFLIGFPALVLLPALAPPHRAAVGWLLILAAGVGLADVLDTFSHIHTPLSVDLLRLVNGLVLGLLLGMLSQALYRLIWRRKQALPA
ncbi:MAG: hypothetical protein GIX02_05470, partial [Candidatus Eremiobacteraeota bacterium]|nr:hypothetical protein [Candidatus Eremiobacteraeota bacterium]